MKVYNHINDLWQYPTAATPFRLSAKSLVHDSVNETIIADVKQWRPALETWLLNNSAKPTSSLPMVIELQKTLLSFPTSYESHNFTANYGRILAFRPDIRLLAAKIHYELSREFAPKLRPTQEIQPDTYLGVHLRTSDDAASAGWLSYGAQSTLYLNLASATGLTSIYVSSGSPSSILKFVKLAQKTSQLKVTSKELVLPPAELEELKALSWDQQALVDYQVLLKGARFGGIGQSSFAWNLALRRHLLSTRTDQLDREIPFEDELSSLFGQRGTTERYAAGIWP
jgi:hypothetical protein